MGIKMALACFSHFALVTPQNTSIPFLSPNKRIALVCDGILGTSTGTIVIADLLNTSASNSAE